MTNLPTTFNASEAAAFLGSHVETVRRLARSGALPAFKVGKDWRFQREALDRWIEQQQFGKEHSVLVIDDDARVRATLARALTRFGLNVRQASNGIGGLDLVHREAPDLILLDLKMPEMNGPQFLAELRKEHPLLPVVIVTGYPDSDLMAQAMQHPPVLLLPKPVEPDLILRTVRVVLGGKMPTVHIGP